MHHLDLDITSQVLNDFNEILKEESLCQLENAEKVKVIEQLHERWSDPDNEVRKRINSFPEKSPDVLKPILEG